MMTAKMVWYGWWRRNNILILFICYRERRTPKKRFSRLSNCLTMMTQWVEGGYRLNCTISCWFVVFIQGKISFNNLKRVAKELGENLTDEELQVGFWVPCPPMLCCKQGKQKKFFFFQEMIDEADKDGDGEVSEAEFLRIMKKTNMY